ncbi:MAG: hypothetical protein WA459_05760 [Stellaceae bacterium]
MSNAGEVVGPPPEEPSDDKKLLDELIFKQDLNEVHLLIDFVSGRADRSLSNLSMPEPGESGRTMSSAEVIRRITQMRYPPDDGPVINAQNAAILLMAKDRLSALASPARGLTIAYTTMFIDAESGRSIWSRLRRLFRGTDKLHNKNAGRRHDTRVDLAQRTFPGLQAHARKFHRWRDGLAWFTLLWLSLTALAYWDVGLGRAALDRLDQDWKSTVSELKDNPDLIHCKFGIAGEQGGTADPAKTGADAKAGNDATTKQFACRRYNYLKWLGETAGNEVQSVFRCEGMHSTKALHVWCWHWLLSGSAVVPGVGSDCASAGQSGDVQSDRAAAPVSPEKVSCYAKANATYWQKATSLMSVFTSYVLPMMFALLGTLIGAFRAILTRIGASELAPRDLVRMRTGIPTGLVAGIAVGLFLSPSSVPVQGAGAVASQLTLTASGLGFLAGYASYSFFGFLDSMIRTVFPDGSAARSPATAATRPVTENQA